MVAHGRDPDHCKVMPGLSVIVAETEEEARRDFDFIQSLIHPIVGREILSTMLGSVDLSKYSLDELLPDVLPTTTGSKGTSKALSAWRGART